jgi:hypothetical protein
MLLKDVATQLGEALKKQVLASLVGPPQAQSVSRNDFNLNSDVRDMYSFNRENIGRLEIEVRVTMSKKRTYNNNYTHNEPILCAPLDLPIQMKMLI